MPPDGGTARGAPRRRRADDVRARLRDWKNEYPKAPTASAASPFADSPTRRRATSTDFNRYSDWIFQNPHDAADEMEWLKRQGPWSPGLIDYLKRHHKQYEALIFFTYLYAPTVLGLQIDPGQEHPDSRGSRRAADPSRHLPGGVPPAEGDRLSHRSRAKVRHADLRPQRRHRRDRWAAASTSRRTTPIPDAGRTSLR